MPLASTSCFPEPAFLQSPDSGGPKEHPVWHLPEQPVSVRRQATTGVGQPTYCMRQGDGLSLMILNLTEEPLILRAKAQTNGGFKLCNTCLKVTAYADDIAVVFSNPTDLQYTNNGLNRTASTLGLRFYSGKCSSPIISRGKACGRHNGVPIRSPKRESLKLSWRIHWHQAYL